MKMSRFAGLAAVLLLIGCGSADAAIRITEWMYQGNPDEEIPAPEAGEFVELTNIGSVPIDMTGWSYDDSSNIPGTFDLSPFGVVLPGESVVWTDWNATLFKNAWGLGDDVDVIGAPSDPEQSGPPGLGRADTIYIYDAEDVLVDSLAYGDEDFPGSPRTRQASANLPLAALGMNNPVLAVLSVDGDGYGSYTNTRLEVGNPGVYSPPNTIPEPTTFALVAVAGGLLVACWRR